MKQKYLRNISIIVSISMGGVYLGQTPVFAATLPSSSNTSATTANTDSNNYTNINEELSLIENDVNITSDNISFFNAYNKTGTVVNLNGALALNLRQTPSTSATILGKIPEGTTITILSENNGWYQINYQGTVGYVSSQYISINTTKLGTSTSNLNLRYGPSTSNSIITTIPKNSSFTVISENNGWYQVNYQGNIGYISTQYVTITTNPEATEESFSTIGRVTNLSGSVKLKLRKGPSTSDTILGELSQGSAFRILSKSDDWYKINYNGTIGYVYGYYVSTLSNSPTNTGISSNLVDFTASWEGYSATPYKDATGNWTVGFGENYGSTYPGSVTYSQALVNLINNLNNFKNQVKSLTGNVNLNQNQLNALTDFAFNLGINSLKNSRLLKDIKNGVTNPVTIKADFQAWSYAGQNFLQGLYNRRTAEANMFLYGKYELN